MFSLIDDATLGLDKATLESMSASQRLGMKKMMIFKKDNETKPSSSNSSESTAESMPLSGMKRDLEHSSPSSFPISSSLFSPSRSENILSFSLPGPPSELEREKREREFQLQQASAEAMLFLASQGTLSVYGPTASAVDLSDSLNSVSGASLSANKKKKRKTNAVTSSSSGAVPLPFSSSVPYAEGYSHALLTLAHAADSVPLTVSLPALHPSRACSTMIPPPLPAPSSSSSSSAKTNSRSSKGLSGQQQQQPPNPQQGASDKGTHTQTASHSQSHSHSQSRHAGSSSSGSNSRRGRPFNDSANASSNVIDYHQPYDLSAVLANGRSQSLLEASMVGFVRQYAELVESYRQLNEEIDRVMGEREKEKVRKTQGEPERERDTEQQKESDREIQRAEGEREGEREREREGESKEDSSSLSPSSDAKDDVFHKSYCESLCSRFFNNQLLIRVLNKTKTNDIVHHRTKLKGLILARLIREYILHEIVSLNKPSSNAYNYTLKDFSNEFEELHNKYQGHIDMAIIPHILILRTAIFTFGYDTKEVPNLAATMLCTPVRGYSTGGNAVKFVELRKELCDKIDGRQRSRGGGTGSGFGPLLVPVLVPVPVPVPVPGNAAVVVSVPVAASVSLFESLSDAAVPSVTATATATVVAAAAVPVKEDEPETEKEREKEEFNESEREIECAPH